MTRLLRRLCWAGALAAVWTAEAEVRTIRAPDGGIQPQAVVDGHGGAHLVYYKGEAAGGDLFYVRWTRDGGFTAPMRVNSRDGSAIAAGTIRGAHLAVGRGGRVHVAWMGSARFRVGGEGERMEYPMLYARLNDAGTGFEPERNLMTWTGGLDGGGSVAADPSGAVYVVWHGSAPGNEEKEAGRAVFVTRSLDDGATFAREYRANRESTGACGCCGMRAYVDSAGGLRLLYRAANEKSRDMTLLSSEDRGETFALTPVSSWVIQACPMSSASFAEGRGRLWVAFETEGRIGVKRVAAGLVVGSELGLEGARGKHPAVAENDRGEVLVVWSEGAGWAKEGTLRWQMFDHEGRAAGERARAGKVPVWSLPTAVPLEGGDFLVIF